MFSTVYMPELMQITNNQKVNIIDVREVDEFRSGHIPGAINIPLSTFMYNYNKLNKNQHYYLVCQSGSRSGSASAFLSQKGYNVTNVIGGMNAYYGRLEY